MNRREFAEEFKAIHARLWLVAAASLGDRAAADDIVQEAALIAFRKRHAFRPGTNFAAWLTKIVKHCAANYNRKQRVRRTFSADPESLDQLPEAKRSPSRADASSPSQEQLDLDDDLLRVLSQLPEVARCCLLLRVVEGATYAEIADQLDIPAGTAMSHVYRSKQRMRERWNIQPESSGRGER